MKRADLRLVAPKLAKVPARDGIVKMDSIPGVNGQFLAVRGESEHAGNEPAQLPAGGDIPEANRPVLPHCENLAVGRERHTCAAPPIEVLFEPPQFLSGSRVPAANRAIDAGRG